MNIPAEEWMEEAPIFLFYEVLLKELSKIKAIKKTIDEMCMERGFKFNWNDCSLEKKE